MRLWVKDSERRPDPPVVQTDDRRAILAGLVLWLLALIALLIFLGPLLAAGGAVWLWTVVVGIGLGLCGLVYIQRRSSRRD